MSVNDFFKFLLRALALFLMVNVLFGMLPSSVSIAMSGGGVSGLLEVVLFLAIMILLPWILIFKSASIVSFLKLGQGFENDHIPFEKLNAITILKLALIIIGASTFLHAIPGAITQAFQLFRSLASETAEGLIPGYSAEQVKVNFAISLLNLLVGYLLITNHDRAAKFLLPKE